MNWKRISLLVLGAVLIAIFLGEDRSKGQTITYSTKSAGAQEYFKQGLSAYDEFNMYKADELFARAVEADSNFAIAWYYWALSAPTTGQFVDRLHRAEALSPRATEPERLMIKSTQAINNNEPNKARDDLLDLVAVVPDDARAHYMLGNYYFDQGEWADAEEQYKEVIKLDSLFAPAYNQLGYVYSYEQQYPAAIAALQKYASLKPNTSDPDKAMGDVYLYRGNYDSSVAAYDRSLRLNPDYTLSLVGKGNNLVFRGKFDSARMVYDQILQTAGSVADTNMAYSHAAWSYLYEGQPDRAIEALEAQAGYAKNHRDMYTLAMIYGELAAVYLENGNYRHALTEADEERDVAMTPGFDEGPRGRYVRNADFIDAIAYVHLENRELADSSMKAYSRSAAASGGVRDIQEYHALMGIAAYWNQDYERAISELKEASPEDPFALYYLGMAYKDSGNREEAHGIFERVAHFNRNSGRYALVRSAARDWLQ